MVVRLRLAVSGFRHNRFFNIVATSQKRRRDGKPIEVLGTFHPRLKPGENTRAIEWSPDRIKYWLGVGAQPSEAVWKVLKLGGIVPTETVSSSSPKKSSDAPTQSP